MTNPSNFKFKTFFVTCYEEGKYKRTPVEVLRIVLYKGYLLVGHKSLVNHEYVVTEASTGSLCSCMKISPSVTKKSWISLNLAYRQAMLNLDRDINGATVGRERMKHNRDIELLHITGNI